MPVITALTKVVRSALRPRATRKHLLAAITVGSVISHAACATTVEEFLVAADSGQCIESVTYKHIESRDKSEAGAIVANALAALSRRAEQQRALGCDGDVAAQAIAAGADPNEVLDATAAGL